MRARSRIETERPVLSEPTPEDAAAVFERHASDSDVTVYLDWPRRRTLTDAKAA